ncbi:MAG: homoserine dehydrogenase [Clostridiales bacterium]|nr:homoserine dehydrogenase [Clostridiales bacterium]
MKVAVMGYGVVGSGVVEVLNKNQESISKRAGQEELAVKYILDLRDFPGDVNEGKFIKDFNIILNDDEVKVVVETMGGLNPAFDFVSKCLNAGKSVVTSNKELVAAKGIELLNIAKEKSVNFLFEASVGGGIPIIRPISQCLAANEIDEIAGILNGTTNFILTKMIEDKMEFADALKLAQDNGYAEKDPTADIEGIDACRKICILASLCYGKHVYPDGVFTQGITKISSEDVEYAKSWGGVIKLIGASKKLSDDKISAWVRPCFVANGSQLASTTDVFNAILVRGDAIGDVVFYGRGAGKLPTASAVVADVIDCAKHVERKKLFGWGESKENYVADYLDLPVTAYVRLSTSDKEKAKSQLGDIKVLTRDNAKSDELAFVISAKTERELNDTLSKLDAEVKNIIPVTDF